jgi:hypothetical protein
MYYLAIRVTHVLLAATWLGATALLSLFLVPAIGDAGASGNAVLAAIGKRGIHVFMTVLGGVTALTGIYLYWRFTGGFSPEISRTPAGMAFGVGGLTGLLATIIGGSVVGRSAKQMITLAEKMPSAPEAERASLTQQIAAIRGRVTSSSRIVLILQVIALSCMAVAHYI